MPVGKGVSMWGHGLMTLQTLNKYGWGMEVYHRGLKPCGGVERAPSRLHAGSFVSGLAGLSAAETGVSGDEAQAAILREAIRRYRAHPRYALQSTA